MDRLNPVDFENLPCEILESIEDAKQEHGWNSVGVRIQRGVEFSLGPIDHVSHVWVDGEETDEELDGICAISASDIRALCKTAGGYFGDHVAIIVGDNLGMGEDPNEVVLGNAEVWEVLA